MSDNGWVIIWEGMSFNSKGVEPGFYANLGTANDDCKQLNNSSYDRRYKVVIADSDEHKAAINHVFSWRW